MSQPFLDAAFKGARFHGSELPVEMLQELTAYRELLIAVARRLFLSDHPSRQRVPRGFADSLSLSLTSIREGSTVATLSRRDPSPELADWGGDVFGPARELIGATVTAVNSNSPVPDNFPSELLPMFNRLGKRLKEDDWIELRPGGATTGPRFSVETKKRILRKLQDEIEVAFTGYAQVTGVHIPTRVVDLRLPGGREVTAEASSETLKAVTSVIPKHESTWLRVGGTASVDVHDRVVKVTELEDVEVVDEEQATTFDRVLRRLDELKSLRDGWLDGDGAGLEARDATWVRDVLLLVIGEIGLPKPGVFPTLDGHIQAEWLNGELQVTLRFDLDKQEIQVEVFDPAHDKDEEESFKRSQGDSVVEFVKHHHERAGA